MENYTIHDDRFLPTGILGRLTLGLLSLLFIAFSGVFVYVAMFPANGPRNLVEWGVRVAIVELFLTLFLLSWAGFIWAIATPKWLPPIAGRLAGQMLLYLMLPWLIIGALYFWPVN